MKTVMLLLAISLSCSMFAQNHLFVRVYDLSGKKFHKGDALSVTDTTLEIEGKSRPDTISVLKIGSIRTKHSAGHNIAIGVAFSTVISAIIAISTTGHQQSDPNSYPVDVISPEAAAATGILVGATAGVVIGGITAATKNSKHFPINGNFTNWKTFQAMIIAYDAKQKKKTKEPDF
jgi:hypothetical protein